MLSYELLRTNINRGKITPLFCTANFGNGTDYELANKLIIFFKNAQKDIDNVKGSCYKRLDYLNPNMITS